MRKYLRRILLFVAVFLLATATLTAVYADNEPASTVDGSKRWNIMLVVDGSGSLYSGPNTDPDGLRYDAIEDLLAILQDDGNNVGAIVFSANETSDDSPEAMLKGITLNTGLMAFDDNADVKGYLINQIRHAPLNSHNGGTTDIGTALLEAEKLLNAAHAENGLPCAVFLFSDGLTEIDYKNVYDKSMENLNEAVTGMAENGIRLCGVLLNKGGQLDSTEFRNIVASANGVSSVVLNLGDSFIEITDASSLHSAVTRFLRILGFSIIEPPSPTYDTVDFDIRVPGVGVEEINLQIFSTSGQPLPGGMDITLTKPDGTVLNGSEVNAMCRIGRTFRVYKISQPECGTWHVHIQVPAGNNIEYAYAPVFSIYVNADFSASPSFDYLHVNSDLDLRAYLVREGEELTDTQSYQEYSCELVLTDASSGELVMRQPIMPDSTNRYKTNIKLSEYGVFDAKVQFVCDKIVIPSPTATMDLSNHMPDTYNSKYTARSGLFQPKVSEFDLSSCYYDKEDSMDMLVLQIVDSSCGSDAVSLSDGMLKINSKLATDGTVTISVTDTQGAENSFNVDVKVKNMTLLIIIITVLVIAAAVAAFIIHQGSKPHTTGGCSLSFTCDKDGVRNPNINISGLPAPGNGANMKTNLYTIITNDVNSITSAINAACGTDFDKVKAYLESLSQELKNVSLSAVSGKVAGEKKRKAKICVKYNKKKSLLYNNSTSININGTQFTLRYDSEMGDGFSGNDSGFGSGFGNSFNDNKDTGSWGASSNSGFGSFGGSFSNDYANSSNSSAPSSVPSNSSDSFGGSSSEGFGGFGSFGGDGV